MDGHSSTSSSVQSVQGDGGDSKENIQPPKFSIYGTETTVPLGLSKLSQTLAQKNLWTGMNGRIRFSGPMRKNRK